MLNKMNYFLALGLLALAMNNTAGAQQAEETQQPEPEVGQGPRPDSR